MKKCLTCGNELKGRDQKKFCSKSCAAKRNNLGVRRHGNGPTSCARCGKPTANAQRKFCSSKCSQLASRVYEDDEDRLRHKRLLARETTRRYYARRTNQTPHDADLKAIQEFYLNCPDGYEVDHIIPISRGGLHSIENLQYLTPEENKRKGNKLLAKKEGPKPL